MAETFRTTQCQECGVVLNVPEQALGKRLKCPKCGHRFLADAQPVDPKANKPGTADARPASSIQSTPVRGGIDDLPVASAPGDLRETFNLPLMMEEDEKPKKPAAPAAGAAASGAKKGGEADAAGLFVEDAPRPKKPKGGAEARSQARRCTCGNVVPAGMSLCSRCGLDLDTGTRINLDEMLEEVTLPPPPPAPPVAIVVIGATCLLASLLLACVTLWFYFAPPPDQRSWGFLLLGLLCGFGGFAAVRFLQGKSAKPLFIALMLAAGVDVIAMIVLPIATAAETPVAPSPNVLSGEELPEDVPPLVPIDQRIDWRRVNAGLVILAGCAGLIIVLTTPQVRRHFERRSGSAF